MSKPAPLNVRFDHCREHSRVLEFWEAVLAQMHRWQSAEISNVYPADFPALEVKAMLNLQRLELECYSSRNEIPVDLLRGHTPQLQHLSLAQVTLKSWDDPVLTQLHTLALCNVSEPGLSFRQLHDILAGSPNLEKVALVDVRFNDQATTHPGRPIHLPELQKVELGDILTPRRTWHPQRARQAPVLSAREVVDADERVDVDEGPVGHGQSRRLGRRCKWLCW